MAKHGCVTCGHYDGPSQAYPFGSCGLGVRLPSPSLLPYPRSESFGCSLHTSALDGTCNTCQHASYDGPDVWCALGVSEQGRQAGLVSAGFGCTKHDAKGEA